MWDVNHAIPQLALEAAGAAQTPVRSYIYGTARIAMNELGTISQVVGVSSEDAPHYYQHDGLGSVVGVSSEDGAEEWAYSYDAFGEAKESDKLSLLAPENPMRFTGEYLDPTGLYHLRARQYDPNIGRFASADPWPPSSASPYVSAYAYVSNRPGMLTDPLGLYGLSDLWNDTVDLVVNEDVANFVAGWGDAGSFGGTYWLRELFNQNTCIDTESGQYRAGEVGGILNWIGISVGTATNAPGAPRSRIGFDRKPHQDMGPHLQLDTWKNRIPGSESNRRLTWPPW